MEFDLVIRAGTVVDGTGGAARTADVAIAGDRIVAVGPDHYVATHRVGGAY